MVEIKISTPRITYRFEEKGGKEATTKYFQDLLRDKKDYTDIDDNNNTIIPYSVLEKSIIEINNLK